MANDNHFVQNCLCRASNEKELPGGYSGLCISFQPLVKVLGIQTDMPEHTVLTQNAASDQGPLYLPLIHPASF